MPDPISHAEMITAYREVLDDQEKIAHIFPDGPAALRIAKLHAVLAHLERTQPTDTQADLTERARALVDSREFERCIPDEPYGTDAWDKMTDLIAAALQSEREAAAAEALRTPFTKALIAKAREDAAAEARRHLQAVLDLYSEINDNPTDATFWEPRARAAQLFLASPPAPQEDETPHIPPIITCPKCGAAAMAFVCSERGCPVNGGAAYE